MRRILAPLALVLLMLPAVATAGEIDPGFARRLQEARAGEQYRAIIMLTDQVDTKALDARLIEMHATRDFRHELVAGRLMQKAAATQGGLLRFLRAMESRGLAADVYSLWITNGILVTATPMVIAAAARFPEVATIYDGGIPVELIEPVANEPALPFSPQDAPEPGLVDINAPALWSLGFRGEGRLVANIDTGVEGTHPALSARWRGRDPGVSSAEAWFDPVTNTSTPTDTKGHGTHTMGTMCGLAGSNQIGVAPGAKWIAAATIDRVSYNRTLSDTLKAFQWCADPDGKPQTITDVPDVCSNSWGTSRFFHPVKACDQTFWQGIDNVEFSGTTVIFAAGNEGTRGGSAGSLRSPADRIASPVNVFAVGALSSTSSIASFSSRGPSSCDRKTIKPEACARGQSVRSSYLRGTYRSLSGTSMACPHVAGAVALLRQVDPHVTAQHVKEILLQTADDLGTPGEDNTFGHGRINCLSAYTQLKSEMKVVEVSAMGTRAQYREGEVVWGHLVVSNTTSQPQAVRVTVGFQLNGAWTSLLVVPPTDLVFPAGFNNVGVPIPVGIPIPTGLPPGLLAPNQWSLKARVEKFGGGTLIHESAYAFTITK